MHFNPRSLAGATCRYLQSADDIKISIHAPSRERPVHYVQQLAEQEFQSTLPRGSDNDEILIAARPVDFNPRSLAGATSIRNRRLTHDSYFNPRSLAGATSTKSFASSRSSFQSTLPCGSDCDFSIYML